MNYAYKISTAQEDFCNITTQVQDAITKSGVTDGIATVFCRPHTTAGIIINENVGSGVVNDMLLGLNSAFPDHGEFLNVEGYSPAHLKASAIGANVNVTISGGKPVLGTCQDIYFCEFDPPRNRKFYVNIVGGVDMDKAWKKIRLVLRVLLPMVLIFLFARYSIYNVYLPSNTDAEAERLLVFYEPDEYEVPTYEPESPLYEPEPVPPQEVALFPPPSHIPVLTYHSIMPMEYYYPRNVNNPWILQLDTFYLQMRYLYENNFSTVTSCQLIDFLFYDAYLPYNPIILTFDDGYLDTALFAAPIMRQFGFVGMQFLITDYIQETSPSMAASPLQFMSPQEIYDTMDVFEFGSHSHAMHRFVDGALPFEFESVENIKADILYSFTFPLTFTTGFVYPFGRYNTNAMQALTEAGVLFAFTTEESYLQRDTPPLLIPRFSIIGGPEEGWTMEHFSDVVWGRMRAEGEYQP